MLRQSILAAVCLFTLPAFAEPTLEEALTKLRELDINEAAQMAARPNPITTEYISSLMKAGQQADRERLQLSLVAFKKLTNRLADEDLSKLLLTNKFEGLKLSKLAEIAADKNTPKNDLADLFLWTLSRGPSS